VKGWLKGPRSVGGKYLLLPQTGAKRRSEVGHASRIGPAYVTSFLSRRLPWRARRSQPKGAEDRPLDYQQLRHIFTSFKEPQEKDQLEVVVVM